MRRTTPLHKGAYVFALVLLLSVAISWGLLFLNVLDPWNYGFTDLLPPCLLLALAAGFASWLRATLEELRWAYSAITAKLQSQVDALEAEVADLKRAAAPAHPESKCED